MDWNYKRDAQGRVTGFVTIISDITEQRQAEEMRARSEQRYRSLAESTSDIVYILDRDGKLLYANRSAGECIGISPAALVGKSQHDLFLPRPQRSTSNGSRGCLRRAQPVKTTSCSTSARTSSG